jgi:hypothetical protein
MLAVAADPPTIAVRLSTMIPESAPTGTLKKTAGSTSEIDLDRYGIGSTEAAGNPVHERIGRPALPPTYTKSGFGQKTGGEELHDGTVG